MGKFKLAIFSEVVKPDELSETVVLVKGEVYIC